MGAGSFRKPMTRSSSWEGGSVMHTDQTHADTHHTTQATQIAQAYGWGADTAAGLLATAEKHIRRLYGSSKRNAVVEATAQKHAELQRVDQTDLTPANAAAKMPARQRERRARHPSAGRDAKKKKTKTEKSAGDADAGAATSQKAGKRKMRA
jgi:hypothetical protein